MAIPKGYLDTCIVSGLAQNDLKPEEGSALLRILEARELGFLEIVTSAVTKTEIDRVPLQHRARHTREFELLARVPNAPIHIGSTRFLGGPVLAAGWREDPLFGQLRNLLPDAEDAEHAFQASRSGADHLITVDRKTFLRYSAEVVKLCGVKLVTPVEFVETAVKPLSTGE